MQSRLSRLQKEGYLVIVEDDADDRLLLQQVFNDLKWEQQVMILNGSEALLYLLEAIPNNSLLPSLIVLDYNMPPLSGEATLLMLKKDKRFEHIPVSIYSTCMDHRRENLLKVLGAFSCRKKPDTIAGLKELMFEYKRFAQQLWYDKEQTGLFL